MPECPRCGSEVINPTKTWSMVSRLSKAGEWFKLTLGIFICPQCGKRFRNVVWKEKERVTFKGVVKEIKAIKGGLGETLEDLREKIEKLKSERAKLLEEIERLKKAGEEKAISLEKEVESLRKEVETLKEALIDLE